MSEFKKWLIDRFIIERKKFDRSGVYAYTQRVMAYNSNKIEGSTLTPEQTASLFDNGTLPRSDDYYRAKDVEEMNLIGGSIAQVVIDDYLLSVETDVQNIQQIVSVFKEGKQCLRLTQNILEQLHMPMNLDQEQKLAEMKDQLSQIEVLLENEISMIWIHQAEEIKKLIEISTKGTNCETTV